MINLLRYSKFINETFVPKNTTTRDAQMDSIIKQKEVTGQVYIDFREYPVTIIKQKDNGMLPLIGNIVKRNPWSAGLQLNTKAKTVYGEFVFYLKPIYASAKLKNLNTPYKLQDVEILSQSRIHAIVYDTNVDKLVENMCKLIYNSEETTGVQKSMDLKTQVIAMAFKKNLFVYPAK